MAKDPAFLFYPNDFTSGTQFFSNEQTGIYIRMLLAQHQHGHLTEKQMRILCGGNADAEIWQKFSVDSEGKFYNQRLENEIVKRKKHSEKQKQNADMRWHKSGIDLAMPLENRNRNENRNKDKDKEENKNKIKKPEIKIPTKKEFLDHCFEVLQTEYVKYEFSLISKFETWVDDGWVDGNGKKIKNWKTKINNTIPYLKPIHNGKQSALTGNHDYASIGNEALELLRKDREKRNSQ